MTTYRQLGSPLDISFINSTMLNPGVVYQVPNNRFAVIELHIVNVNLTSTGSNESAYFFVSDTDGVTDIGSYLNYQKNSSTGTNPNKKFQYNNGPEFYDQSIGDRSGDIVIGGNSEASWTTKNQYITLYENQAIRYNETGGASANGHIIAVVIEYSLPA